MKKVWIVLIVLILLFFSFIFVLLRVSEKYVVDPENKRDMFILRHANGKEISFCQKIEDPTYKMACEGIVDVDLVKCKEVQNYYPKMTCLAVLSKILNEPVLDYEYLSLSADVDDLRFCDEIEIEDIATACYGIVFRDNEKCEQVQDKASREFCFEQNKVFR